MQDNKIYATYAGKRLYNFIVSFKNFSTGNKYTYSKVSLVLSEVLSVTERLNLKSNNAHRTFFFNVFIVFSLMSSLQSIIKILKRKTKSNLFLVDVNVFLYK